MANYAVITDNGGGENQVWHDVEGEEYSFPYDYIDIIKPGTLVVYHRTKKKKSHPEIPGRMSDESHYFGIAEIGEVVQTPDHNYRAKILNYKKFRYPVDIHRPQGGYYEISPFFQRGVRSTVQSVYDDIVAASVVPPIVVAKPKNGRGIKSVRVLEVIKSSKSFDDDSYIIVTASSGYYLQNLEDGVYYKLGKLKGDKDADIKILYSQSDNRGVIILHDGYTVGVISPISNGVIFYETKSDGLEVPISIFM